MSDVDATVADAINREHDLAVRHASDAIEHARRAGELLLQAKSALRHGEWLPWLEANVRVSARQAQRYLAVAQGKPVPLRELKSDTVSHLPETTTPPALAPCAGEGMFLRLQKSFFVIEQATTPDHFFVSRWDMETSDIEFLRRPVRVDGVDVVLKHLGLPQPGALPWASFSMPVPAEHALDPRAAKRAGGPP